MYGNDVDRRLRLTAERQATIQDMSMKEWYPDKPLRVPFGRFSEPGWWKPVMELLGSMVPEDVCRTALAALRHTREVPVIELRTRHTSSRGGAKLGGTASNPRPNVDGVFLRSKMSQDARGTKTGCLVSGSLQSRNQRL